MMGNDVIVGKVAHKIHRFSVNNMHTVEHVPRGVLIVGKGRIEKVCTIPLKICRSSFPHLNRKIGLNITK